MFRRGGSAKAGRRARLRLRFVVLAAVVAIAALSGVACGSSNHDAWEGTSTPTAGPTPKSVNIAIGDNPYQGSANAKVTIVEFADFQGTASATFAVQTLPQLVSNYGDKIRLVFMNMFLKKGDPYSELMAEAGECAKDQGFFWQFHDFMFSSQKALLSLFNNPQAPPPASSGLPQINTPKDALKSLASQLGMDTAKFNSCLDSGQMAGAVQADIQTAVQAYQDAGLTNFGLPAFFINGKYLTGTNYDSLKQAIDAALAAAG